VKLEVSGLGKRFDRGAEPAHIALANIDLIVDPHECVAIVGTSGCGKSTLIRIVAGLERASSGRVRLDQREVSGPTSDVAMVFQEPRLMPWLTVRENVRLAVLKLGEKAQNATLDGALRAVGLTDAQNLLPRELSGGMAQRAAIARALVRKPSVLLLDEPFSALDSFTKTKLQDHLVSLWQDAGFTLLFVTHDVEEAVVLSDRVLVMRGQPGRIHRDIAVDLPRPRERSSPRVQALREEIIAALDLS
jgi:sulfonate transport system ATP-binding protein